MSAVKKSLIMGLALGVIALAGCTPADRSAQPPQSRGETALDPKASLLQVAATGSTSMAVQATGTVAGTPITASGKVAYGPAAKADLTMSMFGQQSSVRLLDRVYYVQLPPGILPGQSANVRWMKIDPVQAGTLAGVDVAGLNDQFAAMDPGRQVEAMLSAGQLKVAGEEQVDGVKTVRYVGELTLDQYVRAYVAPNAQAKMRDALAKAGVTKVTTELWVDEQRRVRKSRTAGGSQVDLTCRYSDFGAPVEVAAPPAAHTADLRELMKRLPQAG